MHVRSSSVALLTFKHAKACSSDRNHRPRLKVRFTERPKRCSSIFPVGRLEIDVPRGAPPFIDEEKLPAELFLSLFCPDRNSSIATRGTIATSEQQRQQQPAELDGFITGQLQRETLNKLIGNSIDDGSAAVCPNTATCRFLAPGKNCCLVPERDHTVLFGRPRKLVFPPTQKQHLAT